jgi:Domain of Unknown Function with PDB structure (DUF3857)/Transglutaminase-like superfamily
MRWVLLLVGMWSAGCATTKADFAPVDWDKLPNAKTYPGEPSVVIHDNVSVHFGPGSGGQPKATTVEQHAVQLLTDSPADTYSTSYYPEWETIDRVSLRVHRPDGEVETLGSKQYFDVPARSGGGVLFTQDRVVGYRVPPLPAGSTIEWLVQTTSTNPQLRITRHHLAYTVRLLHVELTATAAPGFSIEHQRNGVDDPLVKVSDDVINEQQVVRYARDNVPPRFLRNSEPWSSLWWPSVSLRLGNYVEDGVAKHTPVDAQELSRLQHAMIVDRVTPTPDIRALHKTIIAAMPPTAQQDAHERARALYAWTQASIQYCALYETTMGGWVPHEVDIIARERSGDCKDKAAVLSSLLAADGTPSRLAVVYSHDGYPRPMSFPSLIGNHNHMILVVDLPTGAIVADPTTRAVPFGMLPSGDQGAEVLPLSAEGSPIIVTAIDAPEINRLEVSYDLQQAGATAAGTMRVLLHGAYASSARHALLELPSSWYASYIEDLLGYGDRLKLTDVRVEGIAYDGHNTPVVVTARVDAVPLIVGSDTDHPLVSTTALEHDELGSPADIEGGPHVLATLATTSLQIRLQLAAGHDVLSLPKPSAEQGKWTHHQQKTSTAQVGDRTIVTIERVVTHTARVIAGSDREALRKEMLTVRDGVPYVMLKKANR